MWLYQGRVHWCWGFEAHEDLQWGFVNRDEKSIPRVSIAPYWATFWDAKYCNGDYRYITLAVTFGGL